MKQFILKMVEEKGPESLSGLYVTYYDSAYDKNKNGWISGCSLSSYKPEIKNLEHIHIQCDDGFKGHRGISISFDEIVSFHLNNPIGYDTKIQDINTCC